MNCIAQKIKKFFHLYILKRKYFRQGKCLQCGACCKKIYVRHKKSVIKTEEEFSKLQKIHPFYTYLKVIDKDELGLVFSCSNLNEEEKSCKIHNDRPGICRRYPSEHIFSMSGCLSDDCGYSFSPIESFDDVLAKQQKKIK